MWYGGGGGGRRGIWDLLTVLVRVTDHVCVCGCVLGGVRKGGGRGRTLRVELQNVDVAVCVRDGYVELFVRGEEGGCYYFECVGRFAEETELVGILLRSLF